MGLYVDIEKEDEKGSPLGGVYNGAIECPDEAIDTVVESLDKCGLLLTCGNPFYLSATGNARLDEYMRECYEAIENDGEERTIEFAIKVKIRMGHKKD